MKIEAFFGDIMHFIGIGGIGMSGIAEILHTLGYPVQGSDIKESNNTLRLRALGIPVFIGHSVDHVQEAGVIVVSTDIQAHNVELIWARQNKIPVVHRAEMLAELMRLKSAVAIGGTHGKTTTTSMVACLLDAAGIDPTVVNGGVINAYGTNARRGAGPWIVVESDESDGTFVKLPSTVAIVTNIDPEHMNFYHSIEALHQAFYQFVRNIPFYGVGILCIDHPVVRDLAAQIQDRRIITYGFAADADVRAENLRSGEDGIVYDVIFNAHALYKKKKASIHTPLEKIENLFLPMVGRHNVQNSLAAIGFACELGISESVIRSGLQNFQGVKRRFTKTGEAHGITVIDDYGHHPVEINAVLSAAKSICKGNVIAVFQPHRYSRVADLLQDFTECFSQADYIIVAPIHSAGEDPIPDITHERLALMIQEKTPRSVVILDDPQDLASLIYKTAQAGDYVICLGAGTVTEWAYALPQALQRLKYPVAC